MEDSEGKVCQGDEEEDDKEWTGIQDMCAMGAAWPHGVP